jgi:gag-polypeptide of LTR copia-type
MSIQIRLQTLRYEFEMLRMNNTEGVLDYITKVKIVTNQLKRNGENFSEHRVVEKTLRSLTDTFENMVYAIEESKDLTELTVDELIGSLLAHEQRKNLKNKETLKEALQAKVILEEGTTSTRPKRSWTMWPRRVEVVGVVKPILARTREKPRKQKKNPM